MANTREDEGVTRSPPRLEDVGVTRDPPRLEDEGVTRDPPSLQEKGVEKSSSRLHSSDINCCAFSRAGILATGSGDKTVRLWTVR